MSDKIESQAVGFYVNMAANPGTEGYESNPDWKLLVCTSNKGFNSDLGTVDTLSDCDGDYTSVEAGQISWTFSNSFYAIKDPEASGISHLSILSVHKSRQKRQFKLESIDDAGASFYIMGYGLITSVSNTADAGNYWTGDMTVTGSGEYDDVSGS